MLFVSLKLTSLSLHSCIPNGINGLLMMSMEQTSCRRVTIFDTKLAFIPRARVIRCWGSSCVK